MEAISDSEAMMNPKPTKVQIIDQHIPASPPFSSPSVFELSRRYGLAFLRRGI
jgi:hypothetical protein